MKTQRLIFESIQSAGLMVLGLAVLSTAGAAGLTEVRQTIFGMDCAPCAHGMQKRLLGMDGVQDASVSLNEGYARIALKPDNSITLEQIRQVIRENGFTPKDAAVTVSGTIVRDYNRIVLAIGNSHTLELVESPESPAAWRKLNGLSEDTEVAIEGRVGDNNADRLAVLAIRLDR